VWVGETDLRISPDEYASKLKELWFDVTVLTGYSEDYTLWWELKRDGSFQIMGGLQTNRNVVSVEGNKEYIAEFAVWHRAFVPRKYHLYVFHESLEISFELERGKTIQEVLHLMSKH
jgi:hypothetical protein